MSQLDPAVIIGQMQDAHERTLALIEGLNPEQLMGPMLAIVNPLRWEIGHAAYFYEFWVLRHHLGHPPIRADADELYNSITIAHDDRWNQPLPSLDETLAYIDTVRERVRQVLEAHQDAHRDYLAQYAVFHHDMHNEAYTYTRQTLHYSAPDIARPGYQIHDAGGLSGDVQVPGGRFLLGASEQDGFVFDNEKWAHPVEIKPFSIARAAVSNADYLAFVEAGGYDDKTLWSSEGWQWRQQQDLQMPRYWRSDAGRWQIRQFDQWNDMPMNAALVHVSWYEAQAYCKWAGRRLPTEAEWEVAAAGEPSADGRVLSDTKRFFPWGESPPERDQANLDGYALGTIDVGALPAGDSAFGCRQMIGNVWEWTDDDFAPYLGFVPDMYQDYSRPLFDITKVLRGGAWSSRARMLRNTWRTYYGPDRNDVFAGFRTCAL